MKNHNLIKILLLSLFQSCQIHCHVRCGCIELHQTLDALHYYCLLVFHYYFLLKVVRFIAMYTVGVSKHITCTLSGVLSSGYRWRDENGITVASDRRIMFSTNDSMHHKTYTCYGLSNTTFTFRFLHIKFVINGKPCNMHLLMAVTLLLAKVLSFSSSIKAFHESKVMEAHNEKQSSSKKKF